MGRKARLGKERRWVWSATDIGVCEESQNLPSGESPTLTLFLLPRVSFPNGETHEEHEDRKEGSERDEKDVCRTCRQDPTYSIERDEHVKARLASGQVQFSLSLPRFGGGLTFCEGPEVETNRGRTWDQLLVLP
jgi:hypothetical protein